MRILNHTVQSLGLLILAGGALFLHGCATGPGTVAPAGPVSVVGPATGMPYVHDVVHTVGPSETLWRISKTYGVDMNTLMQANNISDPGMIKNGQLLKIPNTTGPKALIPLYPSRRWTHIIVHHTATDEGNAYSIDDIHHKRGWDRGMGYQFLINNGTTGMSDGQIQIGPRWIKQIPGAHTKASGMNECAIGIALVGNFSEQRVSQREMDALVFLVTTLQQYYGIPNRNVLGHRDVPGAATECPGNLFPWQEFKRRIAS